MSNEVVPRHRPQPQDSGVVGDLTNLAGSWLWAAIGSTWEVGAIVAGAALGLSLIGAPAMFVMVVVGLSVVAVVIARLLGVPVVVSWWQTAASRYQKTRLRQRWPQIAVQGLGWDQSFGDQRRRVPQLMRVQRSDAVLRVEIKPLAQQKREKWGEMCDQLRRYVGAAVARWEEPRPGVLAIYLSMQPLPDSLPFPRTSVSGSWDRLRLGVRAGGDQVCWRPSDVPHLLVGGVTKGGKGSAIRNVIYDALASGWRVIVVNPKLSGEYGWLERIGVPVLEVLPEVLEVVERVELERIERQAAVKASGVGSWDKVPGWSAPPLLLAVDEVSALLMVDKANKDVAKIQERLSYVITRLVQLGRSAGIHLVLATQRPDVSTLGPNGGILRDNIDGRIGVCSLQDEGVRMLFGASLDPDVKGVLNGVKGRALATMLSAGDFDVYGMQLYYLDEGELLADTVTPALSQALSLPLLGRGAA